MSFFTGQWAIKYGLYPIFDGSPNDPTSLNYGGGCAERIANLKRRGFGKYGNSQHPEWGWIWWEQNCSRLMTQKKELEAKKAKDEELRKKLESERIARQQAEAKRLDDVAEAQRLAAIEEERLRIQLLEKQKIEFKPEIVATSSLIPLVIISYLVFKK